jgi:hypothetical protein
MFERDVCGRHPRIWRHQVLGELQSGVFPLLTIVIRRTGSFLSNSNLASFGTVLQSRSHLVKDVDTFANFWRPFQ